MKALKYTSISLLLLLAISCSYDDGFEYPIGNGDGDYTYESHSTYNFLYENEDKEVMSTGYLNVNYIDPNYEITVLPDLGWSYNLTGIKTDEITLSDGTIAITFRLSVIRPEINNKEFTIAGTGEVILYDSDKTTSLASVDGYLKNGELVYEFESTNRESGEKTITHTIAYKRH